MKARTAKGTRDFLPSEVRGRRYIFDTLRGIFDLYSYQPIETPAIENLQTLQGKYGEEGDRLLFKILNNGDYLKKADAEALAEKDSGKLLSSISKRGLKYDLTVPFSRFVAMHQHEIHFPFKRYQIQPVWRADRPQKGRYQEFYQCDVDVVGSDSMLCEAELLQIYIRVFKALNLEVEIRVNNRKILSGICEKLDLQDRMAEVVTAIDKMDKVERDGVAGILEKIGLTTEKTRALLSIITESDLSGVEEYLAGNALGQKGIEEMKSTFEYLSLQGENSGVVFDPGLARGLNYYTGFVCEVLSTEVEMGSLGGGGRYDNLTEIFGMQNMSGVGISFGAARIYDVLQELDRFPEDIAAGNDLILLSVDEAALKHNFALLQEFREAGLQVEVYPGDEKLGKQFKYANRRNFRYVMVCGPEELSSGQYKLKEMSSGNEELLSKEQLLQKIANIQEK